MQTATLLTLASLSLVAVSRPLSERQNVNRQRRAPPSYSIVNVDGSDDETTPAPTPKPTTVVETVTAEQTQTAFHTETRNIPGTTEIRTTTLVVTDSDSSANTVVVTYTTTAKPSVTTATVSVDADTVTDTATVTASPSAPSTTTSYYDDGSWHTYYPIEDFNPYSTLSTSSPPSAASSTTSSIVVDPTTFTAVLSATRSPTSDCETTSIPATISLTSTETNAFWTVPTITTPADYPFANSTATTMATATYA